MACEIDPIDENFETPEEGISYVLKRIAAKQITQEDLFEIERILGIKICSQNSPDGAYGSINNGMELDDFE